MKTLLLAASIFLQLVAFAAAQVEADRQDTKQSIIALIDQYSHARETKDAALLKSILVENVDQLVSSGEWRRGLDESLKGMLRSSTRRPGSRTLTVEHIRFLGSKNAIVDARYEIENADGTFRKMWSTFVVTFETNRWKISAIRNMLPAR